MVVLRLLDDHGRSCCLYTTYQSETMTPKNFADLVEAIEAWLEESDSDDRQVAHPLLAEQMASAARAVYRACADGQNFAEEESK